MESYLVILNKTSGAGNSEYIFKKYVKNKLEYNFILLNRLDKKYDNIKGIIIIGGDGTVSDVINYLYLNNLHIPICHVPAGSGNGLCKSILFSLNKKFCFENAVNLIKYNNNKKLDLFDVNLSNCNKVIPSFLSISWGIISDIDINTEWLRYLGELRFTFGAIWYLLFKKSYYGTLKYLDKSEKNYQKWNIVTGNFIYFLASNVSHISSSTYSNPGAELDDETIHITYIKDDISRIELLWLLLGIDNGSHMKYLKYIKTTKFTLIPKNGLLTIDGELQKNQKIDVSISRSKVNIFG